MRKPSYKWEGCHALSFVFEIDAPSQGSARRQLGALKRRLKAAIKSALDQEGIHPEVLDITGGSFVQAFNHRRRK